MSNAADATQRVPETARHRDGRLLELDLLRLVAALMVVAAHYFTDLMQKHRFNLDLGAIFHWHAPLSAIAQFGAVGVGLFFMISGYVIALSAEGRTAREFLVARVARILPAFWFCCILTWLVISLDPGYRQVSWLQLIANLFFVARPLGFEFVDAVYWSLVIEMRFYLMVALVIWWRGAQALPTFFILWLALAALDQWGLVPRPLRFLTLPQYAAFFVAGGALYLVGRKQQVLLGHLLGAIALVLICINAEQQLPPLFKDRSWIAAGVMVASYLALWMIATRRTAWLGRSWMVTAGTLTYPLYLLHEDLGFMFMRHFPATGFAWIDNRITITLSAIVVSLLLAYAVAKFVERPIAPLLLRWGKASHRPMASPVRESAHG